MSFATSTTSALSQLPSIGTSGSGGGGGTSRSASYFFGFLVTFAVLLVIFVVAGFISRHRLQARRRAAVLAMGIGAGDPWVYGYRERRVCEMTKVMPVWTERWFEDPDTSEKARRANGGIGKWEDIMPLSATLTCLEPEPKPNEEAQAGEEEKIRRTSTSTISSWLSSFSTTKDTGPFCVMDPSPSHLPIQNADFEARVDVVVMIAMPRSPDTRGYEFGVANVPLYVGQPRADLNHR